MYVAGSLNSYDGLGNYFGAQKKSGAAKSLKKLKKGTVYENPEEWIPKKHAILNADEASLYLKSPPDYRGIAPKPGRKVLRGQFYWTPTGPLYNIGPVPGAKTASTLPPPKQVLKAPVEEVRDLPRLNLPPTPTPKVQMEGYGDGVAPRWVAPLVVLGLLFIVFAGYNASSE